jgi:ketosteroid isomerase-like protein
MPEANTHAAALQLVEPMFAAEFAFMRSDPPDPGLLEAAFDRDVVVHEPGSLPYAGDWQGLEGVAALIGLMRDTWSEMAVEDLAAVRDGDAVFLSCTLRLVSRATGRSIDQPFAEVLRFRDGRLLEGRPFYFDTDALLATIS